MAVKRKRSKNLALKLKQIRESMGWSQKDLRENFGISEVKNSAVSMWESGDRTPSIELLIKYAESANICLDILLNDNYELPAKLPSKKAYHPH